MLLPVVTRHPPRGTRSADTRLPPGGWGGGAKELTAAAPIFSGLLLMPMLLEAKIKSSYPPRHLSHPMLQRTGLGILSGLETRQVCKPESCQLLSMRFTQWWANLSRASGFTLDSQPDANAVPTIQTRPGEKRKDQSIHSTHIQHLHLPLLRIGGAKIFMLHLLCLCLFPQLHQLILPLLSRGVDDVLFDTENASLDNS